jgi:hypothetical protein
MRIHCLENVDKALRQADIDTRGSSSFLDFAVVGSIPRLIELIADFLQLYLSQSYILQILSTHGTGTAFSLLVRSIPTRASL